MPKFWYIVQHVSPESFLTVQNLLQLAAVLGIVDSDGD